MTRKLGNNADYCLPDHKSECCYFFILFHLSFSENFVPLTNHTELCFKIFLSGSTDSPSVNIQEMRVLHLLGLRTGLLARESTYPWAV